MRATKSLGYPSCPRKRASSGGVRVLQHPIFLQPANLSGPTLPTEVDRDFSEPHESGHTRSPRRDANAWRDEARHALHGDSPREMGRRNRDGHHAWLPHSYRGPSETVPLTSAPCPDHCLYELNTLRISVLLWRSVPFKKPSKRREFGRIFLIIDKIRGMFQHTIRVVCLQIVGVRI